MYLWVKNSGFLALKTTKRHFLGWLTFYRLGWVEFYRYHQLADKVITKIRPFINVNANFGDFGLLVNAYFIAKGCNKYLVVHNFCNCWLYRITSFVCICIYIVFVVSCIRWKRITVFENHRKSLIQHCERSKLRLHFK